MNDYKLLLLAIIALLFGILCALMASGSIILLYLAFAFPIVALVLVVFSFF